MRSLVEAMKVRRYEFIRDFCVVDMGGQGCESPTAIYYIPELAIETLDLSYELVLQCHKFAKTNAGVAPKRPPSGLIRVQRTHTTHVAKPANNGTWGPASRFPRVVL